MRILKAPITATGHVRYVELVKWLLLVMTVVMSFSYAINQLETQLLQLRNAFAYGSLLVVMVESIRTLIDACKEIHAMIKATLIPWIQAQVMSYKKALYQVRLCALVQDIQITIKTFDWNHICVMRC